MLVMFKQALINYLKNASLCQSDEDCVWDIVEQEPYGRCMVAKRDIQVHELILNDKPLLIGPRVYNYDKIFCVCCYKILGKLTLCTEKCKYPVCGDCSVSKAHQKECELIKSWKLKNDHKYSKYLFRALTVIRGLLLSESDTALMHMMACHENGNIQNMEVDKILDEFDGLTAECETIQELKKISAVLNTNAFEVGIANISLRGLYPLAAVMNHNCVPNIRYAYEENSVMVVRASKLIKKGEQIFNSYTKFLWGTQQRRVHLGYSKNFMCQCERCLDPTEFNCLVGAIKCIRPDCDNHMLPLNPLVITSPWKCDKCNMKLDHARVSKIYDIFSKQIFNRILKEPMSSMNQYLKEKLWKIMPPSNQFTIEVKLQIILKLKQDVDYTMSLEDYQDIEQYCYDVLDIITRLKAGECFVKGLLYYEMVKTKLKILEMKNLEIDEAYGKADHNEAKNLLKTKYQDYVIECSDEGY
ncbi:unnamed protein product [Diamesa hyperborea]